jgi:cytoskeletal protein RodZ
MEESYSETLSDARGGTVADPSKSEESSGKTTLELILGAAIVIIAVGFLFWSLIKVLDHYPAQKETTSVPVQSQAKTGATGATGATTVQVQTSDDRSTSVVAVLAPVTAGIIGIVGLYFGIAGTAASRAKQAEAVATQAEAVKKTAETVQTQAEQTPALLDFTGAMTPTEYQDFRGRVEEMKSEDSEGDGTDDSAGDDT